MAAMRAAEGVPAPLGFIEAKTGFPNGESDPQLWAYQPTVSLEWAHAAANPTHEVLPYPTLPM